MHIVEIRPAPAYTNWFEMQVFVVASYFEFTVHKSLFAFLQVLHAS